LHSVTSWFMRSRYLCDWNIKARLLYVIL
jgi:hypothetical protein